MIGLIVNNTIIDLPEDIQIPLNVQSSYAQSISDIYTSFTNTFLIPYTTNNAKALSNNGSVFTTSYREIYARMLFNGRDLFGTSRLIVLDFNSKKGWRCSFIASNINQALIGSVRDIDLEDEDLAWTAANFAANADNTEGVLTAPMYCGGPDYIDAVDVKYGTISVYIFWLLQRMFAEIGIALTKSELTVSTFFDRLVLPSLEMKANPTVAEESSFLATVTTAIPFSSVYSRTVVVFPNTVSGNVLGHYDPTDGYWTSNTAKVNIAVKIVWKPYVISANVFTVELCVNAVGSRGTVTQVLGTATTDSAGTTSPRTLYLNIEDYEYDSSDELSVRISYPSADLNDVFPSSSFEVEVQSELLPGGVIGIAQSLPDIKKADLFNEVIKITNSIVIVKQNEIEISNFDNLGLNGTKDISRMLDKEKEEIVELHPSQIGQKTIFAWSNDSDLDENLACGYVQFNNSSLSPTVEWYRSKFSASTDKSFLSGLLASALIPIYSEASERGDGTCTRFDSTNMDFSEPHGLSLYDYFTVEDTGETFLVSAVPSSTRVTVFSTTISATSASIWNKLTYERNSPQIRIAFASEDSFSNAFNFYLESNQSGVTSYKQVQFIGDAVEGLMWPALLRNFFRLWLGSMEDYKLVKASFMLNDDFVLKFDPTIPVYVNKYGTSFYIQKINQYISENQSAQVELFALRGLIDTSKILDL